MTITIPPYVPSGTLAAIPSKSMAHRLLLCAALSDAPVRIVCPAASADIEATIRCIDALGGCVTRRGDSLHVTPIKKGAVTRAALDCGESGSTLRFLLPVAAGLGIPSVFTGSERLSKRPLEPLHSLLTQRGCTLSPNGVFPLTLDGQATGGAYAISGAVSSQFITGLLMMLPLVGGGSVTITDNFESKSYVDMTVLSLKQSDIDIREDGRTVTVRGGYHLRDCAVEGDWSNAAFWLAAGALGGDIAVDGLSTASAQGDRQILPLLSAFGAHTAVHGQRVAVRPAPLRGSDIDAADIPDLVPVLSVVAALADGETRIRNAGRLRLKESDRLETTAAMLRALGGRCDVTDDGLRIVGMPSLRGGTVDGANDHRIVMAAAVAASRCSFPVVIQGAEAKDKSYPSFFCDLLRLGATVKEE
ncbi:MAG: 3-phosphoshikimate 1-carboxyvinyltransferase [Clostridiaceae bacterium]|nr:3-phosphoshikimate 1-carboxyvinyltransferase [Clostridiaceae bacterium]